MNQSKEFFNRWAANYDRGIYQFWMKHFQKPLLKIIPLESSVVDISCGTGELLQSLHLQGHDPHKLVGVDISEKMLEKAKNKLPQTIKLIEDDIQSLPFPDIAFDYAVSTEAFHHYPDQEKALLEMKRVAKQIIIIDVNFFLPFIHHLFERWEPGCVKINNRKEMYALFQNAGLQNITQQRVFGFAILTQGHR